MIVTLIEAQNNFGRYIELANEQEIIVTKNGSPVARIIGIKGDTPFLSDKLVGIIPIYVSEKEAKDERLERQ